MPATTAESLIAYGLTLAVLTAAPGPLVAVMVARTLVRDVRGAVAFAAGVCLGDVLAVSLICGGLGLWAQSAPGVFEFAKGLGALYLFWLAWKMWSASAADAGAPVPSGRWAPLAVSGVVSCLGSPQTMLFYSALLPGVASLHNLALPDFCAVILATCLAITAVFAAVICFAGRARNLLDSPGKVRACGRALAAGTALAAVWILAA